MNSLINHNAEEIYYEFLESIENSVKEPLYPGDERRIISEAVIFAIVSFLAKADDATKQKFLQNARGDILDANGEAYGVERIQGNKATTEMAFSLQTAVSDDVVIPAGTLVTNDSERFFETLVEGTITSGETSVSIPAAATESGSKYNDIEAGEIDVLVSNIAYIDNVSNTVKTTGGTDDEDDDTYRERIRLSQNRYASGTENYYKYHAMTADTNIQDILITNEEQIISLGVITDASFYFSTENIPAKYFDTQNDEVQVYYKASESATTLNEIDCDTTGDNVAVFNKSETALQSPVLCIPKQIPGVIQMFIANKNGEVPTAAELLQISSACNDSAVRSFNDRIVVKAANVVNYTISVDVYIDPNEDVEAIKTATTQAVEKFKEWQYAKIGRQINKDKLQMFIMQAGAYKVTVNSPTGASSSKTAIAVCSNTTINFVIAEEE